MDIRSMGAIISFLHDCQEIVTIIWLNRDMDKPKPPQHQHQHQKHTLFAESSEQKHGVNNHIKHVIHTQEFENVARDLHHSLQTSKHDVHFVNKVTVYNRKDNEDGKGKSNTSSTSSGFPLDDNKFMSAARTEFRQARLKGDASKPIEGDLVLHTKGNKACITLVLDHGALKKEGKILGDVDLSEKAAGALGIEVHHGKSGGVKAIEGGNAVTTKVLASMGDLKNQVELHDKSKNEIARYKSVLSDVQNVLNLLPEINAGKKDLSELQPYIKGSHVSLNGKINDLIVPQSALDPARLAKNEAGNSTSLIKR